MLRKFLNFFRSNHLRADLREEMAFHQARTSGRFGNATLIEEQMRDASTIGWLETTWQDLRYGVRSLRRTPGVSAMAVLSLALGLGANTAIFTLVNRLVLVNNTSGYVCFQNLRHRDTMFAELAGVANIAGLPVNGSLNPADMLNGRLVSANYFRALGVVPVLGSVWREEHADGTGIRPVVVISHAFWVSRLEADTSIVGKTVRLGTGRLTSDWNSGAAMRIAAGCSAECVIYSGS